METIQNPIPPPFDSYCFCAPNILNSEEVSRLVSRIKDGTQIDTRNLPTPVEPLEDNATRIVERVSVHDEELAEFLFDKVKQLCPPVWIQEKEDEHLGTFSRGEWELENVHPRIQFYRYQPGTLANLNIPEKIDNMLLFILLFFFLFSKEAFSLNTEMARLTSHLIISPFLQF